MYPRMEDDRAPVCRASSWKDFEVHQFGTYWTLRFTVSSGVACHRRCAEPCRPTLVGLPTKILDPVILPAPVNITSRFSALPRMLGDWRSRSSSAFGPRGMELEAWIT